MNHEDWWSIINLRGDDKSYGRSKSRSRFSWSNHIDFLECFQSLGLAYLASDRILNTNSIPHFGLSYVPFCINSQCLNSAPEDRKRQFACIPHNRSVSGWDSSQPNPCNPKSSYISYVELEVSTTTSLAVRAATHLNTFEPWGQCAWSSGDMGGGRSRKSEVGLREELRSRLSY